MSSIQFPKCVISHNLRAVYCFNCLANYVVMATDQQNYKCRVLEKFSLTFQGLCFQTFQNVGNTAVDAMAIKFLYLENES